MGNRAYRRALASLAHPLTVCAVILLLVNDFVLRRLWPSWLTGKLGDAAWLAFAPLALAAVLAWLIPPRTPRHEQLVAAFAFGLTGLTFTLVKGVPAIHAAVLPALEVLTGAPSQLLADPTDLLTLPAMLAGWAVWQARGTRASRPLPRYGVTVLGLAALATLANSPAPNYGIECIEQPEPGLLVTRSSWGDFGSYVSRDGGLTWEAAEPGQFEPAGCDRHREPWEVGVPGSPEIVYRAEPGAGIERSADGGETWTREVNLRGSEARGAYHAQRQSGNTVAVAGPLDLDVDEATGSVVAAMGHDGVLTRTPDGEWHRVAVGPYEPAEIDTAGETLSLLSGELMLAAALALLALASFSLLVERRSWPAFILPVGGWLAWLAAVLMQPALSLTPSGYMSMIIYPAMAFAGVLPLLSLAITGVRAYRRAGGWQKALLGALLAGVLFLLPYVLWALGGIPRYVTATIFALLLAATVLIAGGWQVRRGRPPTPPEPASV